MSFKQNPFHIICPILFWKLQKYVGHLSVMIPMDVTTVFGPHEKKAPETGQNLRGSSFDAHLITNLKHLREGEG